MKSPQTWEGVCFQEQLRVSKEQLHKKQSVKNAKGDKKMSIPFAGKGTFRLQRARKSAMQHLQNTGRQEHIKGLPKKYPAKQKQMTRVEITSKTKILRSHLTDAFPRNIFSVRVDCKNDRNHITVIHDAIKENVECITALYADSNSEIVLEYSTEMSR